MPGHVDDVTTEGMRALMSSGRNKVPAESPGCHLRALLAKAPKWVSSSPQAAASGWVGRESRRIQASRTPGSVAIASGIHIAAPVSSPAPVKGGQPPLPQGRPRW